MYICTLCRCHIGLQLKSEEYCKPTPLDDDALLNSGR
jgi:hypothetical protein